MRAIETATSTSCTASGVAGATACWSGQQSYEGATVEDESLATHCREAPPAVIDIVHDARHARTGAAVVPITHARTTMAATRRMTIDYSGAPADAAAAGAPVVGHGRWWSAMLMAETRRPAVTVPVETNEVPPPAAPPEPAPAPTPPAPAPDLNALSDEALLAMRFCDLGLAIAGSWLEPRVAQLNDELAGRGLSFRPHYWLSAEWFTPDGVPGIAIPFYLAHPRLMKLEKAQMLEVEGGTPDWCLKILRHEAGHAIDNAYRLRRRRKRIKLFGSPSQPYPDFYLPKPYSKSFVLHLDSWYAQSHPDEDFAETFAVWLTPDSDWATRYEDWPALRKLEYMHALMGEIAGTPPLVTSRREVEPLARLRTTLGRHYAAKRTHYGVDYPHFHDRDLRRLFSNAEEFRHNRKASRFIHAIRRDVRRLVAEWTGTYQYTIDRVIEDIVTRCDDLGLRLKFPEDRTKQDFTVLVTVQTMNYLHSGRHRLAL
jgi:hypothetical protein